MSQLPYAGICVVERSGLLSARLLGLLLADQGAQVLVARSNAASQAPPDHGAQPHDPGLYFEHLDPYLNRGKGELQTAGLEESKTADIIIVQGLEPVAVQPWQILVRVLAALPGDASYGALLHGYRCRRSYPNPARLMPLQLKCGRNSGVQHPACG